MATIDPHTASAVPVIPPSGIPHQNTRNEPFEWRILLNNVSWETYERLSEEIDNPGTRLTYDDGRLEIMSPLEGHERYKELLGQLVEVLTEELAMPRRATGSTTWRQIAKKKGLEADKSYYLANLQKVRKKKKIDLAVDPPPDLAIEVENTRSSVNQLDIYSSLGVPEVWRFDGDELHIHGLQSDGSYSEQDSSRYFPKTATEKMVEALIEYDDDDDTAWIKRFRQWVRDNLVK
jgi:Uma2 family endonuclease